MGKEVILKLISSMESNEDYNSANRNDSLKYHSHNLSYSGNYSDPVIQKLSYTQPKKVLNDNLATSGSELADIDTNITSQANPNTDPLDLVFQQIGVLQNENKEMMVELMGYQSDYSKINTLRNQIDRASKHNRELLVESKAVSQAFVSKSLKKWVDQTLSPKEPSFKKYEKGLTKLQNRFNALRLEAQNAEGKFHLRHNNCDSYNLIIELEMQRVQEVQNTQEGEYSQTIKGVDIQIYKEQQETKLLRLKYEGVLDRLDKQIDRLEIWIGMLLTKYLLIFK